MEVKKRIKTLIEKGKLYRKERLPVLVWLYGYFVGLKKELNRTRWLKGKPFLSLSWKVFLVIIVLAGTLFLINYCIIIIFGATSIY